VFEDTLFDQHSLLSEHPDRLEDIARARLKVNAQSEPEQQNSYKPITGFDAQSCAGDGQDHGLL
jgi:hypothetical protein